MDVVRDDALTSRQPSRKFVVTQQREGASELSGRRIDGRRGGDADVVLECRDEHDRPPQASRQASRLCIYLSARES